MRLSIESSGFLKSINRNCVNADRFAAAFIDNNGFSAVFKTPKECRIEPDVRYDHARVCAMRQGGELEQIHAGLQALKCE